MRIKIEGYLRALKDGTLEKYHDYHDVHRGTMKRKDYEKKWGNYTGDVARRKHEK